ncbi:MAG TPA: haloacid dehalogenase type II [Pararobbsia sp.]|nr:haloacid dehalogenase type II [Pararobbsia sp.]
MPSATTRSRVMVFDVNETLLDITVLEPFFTRVFGRAGVMRQWFAELVLYSQTLTLSGHYMTFADIGAGVLAMLSSIHAVPVHAADREELVDTLRHLPAHPDVEPALESLSCAGFRLATLTNSAPTGARTPLDNAGLSHWFEKQFSVDQVRRFKPAPETYGLVARGLGIEPARIRLIAAHPWDTLGAQAAGCVSALVTRTGNAVLPIGPQPDVIGPDLPSVAARIIEVDRDEVRN